jgi:hypothetical protein
MKPKHTHAQQRSKDRAAGQTTMTISISEDLKEQIQRASEAENRKMSNWIVTRLSALLKEEMRANGDTGHNGHSPEPPIGSRR